MNGTLAVSDSVPPESLRCRVTLPFLMVCSEFGHIGRQVVCKVLHRCLQLPEGGEPSCLHIF